MKHIWTFLKKEKVGSFILFLLAEIIYLTIVQMKSWFDLREFYVWLFFLRKIIFDWLLYSVGASLILRVLKSKFTAGIYSAVYVFLVFADSAIYMYGNTIFQKVHLQLITSYSLNSFINLRSFVLVAVMLLLIPLMVQRQIRSGLKTTDKRLAVYSGLLILVWLFNFPDTYLENKIENINKISGLEAYTLSCQADQLSYVTKNPLINFVDEVLLDPANNRKIDGDISKYSDVIQENNLPIGTREYSDLNLKKFKRIILFTSESLSLDLLSDYNKDLTVQTSAFYGSDAIKDKMFTNYRTAAHNTLEGLLATLDSHPNARMFDMRAPEFFQNSLVNILKNNGYDTIFLRSASKYYASENIYFKNLGFKEIIAREYFELSHPKYVDGWGIIDQVMYNHLVDLLKEKKDENLFITVLGTDTHPLDGREDYHDLQYPAEQGDFTQYTKAGAYLKAIAKHDYDVGQTIKKIQEAGLLDDETLIILTADHACPLNDVVSSIKGYPQTNLARIPLVFLTGQKLPEVKKDTTLSQLDLAPTILHMLNIKVPDGYWGDSIFAENRKENYVGFDRNVIYFENKGRKYQINVDTEDPEEQKIVDFFRTLIVSPKK